MTSAPVAMIDLHALYLQRQAWLNRARGYYVLAHGLGMAGEHPKVPRVADGGSFDFPGQIPTQPS